MSDVQSFKRGFEMALSRKLKLQQSNEDIVPVVPANAAPTPAAAKQPNDEQYRTAMLRKVRDHYYRQQQVHETQQKENTNDHKD